MKVKFLKLMIIAGILFLSPLDANSFQLENKTEDITKDSGLGPSVHEQVKEAAQETSKAISDKAEEVLEDVKTSRSYRANSSWQLGADFSYLDLMIPAKVGLHAQYLVDADTSYEIEYLKGTVSIPFLIDDLGGLQEERLSVIRRKFFGTNSFNFFYGLSYFSFKADLGSEYLQSVSPSQRTHFDVVQIQSVGFQIGMGNRWHLHPRVVLGIDWIAWSQPVFETYRNSEFLDQSSSESDKDNVRNSLSILSYFPRLTLAKVQLAYSF